MSTPMESSEQPLPGEAPAFLAGEAVQKTNSLALISLIGGILGFLSSCLGSFITLFIFPVLAPFCLGGGGLLGIAGLVTGIIATNQLKTGAEKGRGMAVAGIILGALDLLISCLLILLVPVLLVMLGPWVGEVFSEINSGLVVP